MTAPTRLLERDDELTAIERSLDAVASGEGGPLVIEGEAGAGKTALLGAMEQIAGARGMRVLRARAGEYERDFPYGVVRQLFEPAIAGRRGAPIRLEGSAALAAPVFAGTSAVDSFSIQHGLYWLASDLAEDRPLLVVVDDAQWADLSSLQALLYIGRRLEGADIGMAVTVRRGERDAHQELLDELRTDPRTRLVKPLPLSAGAVAELAAGAGRPATEGFAEACRTATGGNPFLVVQLISALESEGGEGEPEDGDHLARLAATGASRAILGRLARLGPDEKEVARAVAILEPNAEGRLIGGLAGLPLDRVTAAGAQLVSSSLLVDGRPLAFVHPLVREAVLNEMGEPGRAFVHARAARLLDEDDAELDTVAAHLLLAEPAGEEWVVGKLRSAAEVALGRGAAATAVGYLRRASEEPPPAAQRLDVRRELGATLLRNDDGEGVEILREVCPQIEDDDVRAETAAVLANSLMFRSMPDEAEATLFEALAGVADRTSPTGINLHLHLLLMVLGGFENLPEDYLPGPDRDLGPDSATVRAVLGQAALFYALGMGPISAVPLFVDRIGTDLAVQASDARLGLPRTGVLIALALADIGDGLADGFEASIEGSRQRGSLSGISGVHGSRSYALFLDGELAGAQVDAETALRISARSGFLTPARSWLGAGLLALTARGDLDGAEAMLDRYGSGAAAPGLPAALRLIGSGGLHQARGRHREACEDFRAAGRRLAWIANPNPEAVGWQPGLATSLAALGETEEARAVAAEALESAEATGGSRGVGIALRVNGVVAADAEGIEILRSAAEVLGSTRAGLQHAHALVELGAALRRANHRKEAREPLREGLEVAHHCGAALLEERARTELAAAGARPRSVVRTGVDALTPSELRVATLAMQGLTNRQIAQTLTVTPKTVETHLRHVFQKLDLTKRTELAGPLGD